MHNLNSDIPDGYRSQAEIDADFTKITGIDTDLSQSEDIAYSRVSHSQAGPRDYQLAEAPDYDFIDGPLELQNPTAVQTANSPLNPLAKERIKYRNIKLFFLLSNLSLPVCIYILYFIVDFKNDFTNLEWLSFMIVAVFMLVGYLSMIKMLLGQRRKLKEAEVKYDFLLEVDNHSSTSAGEFEDGARL